MNAVLNCRLCDQRFLGIPEGVVLLKQSGIYGLYRFPSGELHDLRVLPTNGRDYTKNAEKSVHTRWHKNKRKDCNFCFPLQASPRPAGELK